MDYNRDFNRDCLECGESVLSEDFPFCKNCLRDMGLRLKKVNKNVKNGTVSSIANKLIKGY